MASEMTDSLVGMGFPQDLVNVAVRKHPNSLEAAADYCINPPSNWEQAARQDAGHWDPPPSRPDVPLVGWADEPSSAGHHMRGNGGTGVDDHHSPVIKHSQQQQLDQAISSSSNRQSPPPSRPEPLPSYHASQQQFPTQGQPNPSATQTTSSSSSNDPSEKDCYDLAKAIALSMKSSGSHFDQSDNASNQGASAGWSASTGSWTQHTEDKNARSRTSEVTLRRSALDYLRESASTAPQQQQPYSGAAAYQADGKSMRDVLEETPAIDQVRSGKSPVELLAPGRLLTCLPPLLQVLYATPHVRNALLALPLSYMPEELSYAGYWKGESTSTMGPTGTDLTLHHQIHLLKALQRLFVFMAYTRRRKVVIIDFAAALASSVSNVFDPSKLQEWPKPEIAVNTLRTILDAWRNVVPHVALTTSTAFDSSRMVCIPATSGRPGPTTLSASASTENTDSTEVAEEGEDASRSPTPEEGATTEFPLQLSDATTTLYEALEKTLHTTGSWISTLPEALFLNIDRTQLSDSQTHVLKLESQLAMDRFLWKNRHEVLERARKKQALVDQKAKLETERDQLKKHEDKDYVGMLQTALKYFSSHALAKDDQHREKQENMKTHLQNLLAQAQARLAEKDAELGKVDQETGVTFENLTQDDSALMQLNGMVSWTGLSSNDMMFGYFRTSDGNWYKQLDGRVEASNVVSAIEDSAGSWMRAGPYILSYSSVAIQPWQAANSEPQMLLNAVEQDNQSLLEKLGSETTKGRATSSDEPTEPSVESSKILFNSDTTSKVPQDEMQVDSNAATPSETRQ